MADDSRFSPILAGGIDEYNDHAFGGCLSFNGTAGNKNCLGCDSLISERTVLWELPYSACRVVQRGYQRFECDLEQVCTYFSSFEFKDDARALLEGRSSAVINERSHPLPSCFHFTGGLKFLPGMLDCRPFRKNFSYHKDQRSTRHGPIGEMMLTRNDLLAGVPTFTLAELHWDICHSLREREMSIIAPSLVECAKCFEALCKGKQHGLNNTKGVEEQTHIGLRSRVK
eukprot:804646-Ditylum_brightwellii.AAC.1